METMVRKWGNSLGVRLSRSAAQEAHVSEGSTVDVRVKNGEIRVRPRRKAKYHLQDMIAAIHPGNIHDALDADRPKGRELL